MWFLISLFLSFALNEGIVPVEKLRAIGSTVVKERYGLCHYRELVPYYDLNDEIVAYALVFEDANKEPVTIVMGALLSCSPIFEISKTLPNYYKNLTKARTVAMQTIGIGFEFKKIYYFGPQEEYFGFSDGNKEILVNTYSFKIFNKKDFLKSKPIRNYEIEEILRQKWNRYLTCPEIFGRDTTIGYVDSVPFVYWRYNCASSSAAMVLGYWDPREYGRLVDFYCDSLGSEIYPNVLRELALAIGSAPSIPQISYGIIYVTDSLNGYDFTSLWSPPGNPANQFYFSWIKNEIDNQRPCLWLVLHYQGDPSFNQSTCAVGYVYSAALPDTFIIVHNTWTNDEPWWPLWTYQNGYLSSDRVITVVPGAGIPDNLFITFPTDSGIVLYYNITYYITWQTKGTEIDHLKIWYADEYDSLTWTLITAWAPNTGLYPWSVPAESLYGRINLAGLNTSDSLTASDGSFYRFTTRPIIASPNLQLFGHIPLGANDVVNLGNYLYLYRDSCLCVYDISDLSLPMRITNIKVAGRNGRLCCSGSYLYLSTGYDRSLQIVDISDPTNPVLRGSLGLPVYAMGLCVSDTICYLANATQGLKIISIANPDNPYEIGSYNTSGISYDVLVVDTLAIVADGNSGIVLLNVKELSNPTLISNYNTPGSARGLDYNGYLYLSDGISGLGIIDISNPALPDSVAWYNTPGFAYRSRCYNNNIFVADGGAGLRILNSAEIANIYEEGYLDTYGNGLSLFLGDTVVFLADASDGGLIIDAHLAGITEDNKTRKSKAELVKLEVYPNPFSTLTKISVGIAQSAEAEGINTLRTTPLGPSLKIYDATGRLVKSFPLAGFYSLLATSLDWDGTDDLGHEVPAGVYFVQLKLGDYKRVEKAILLR